MDAHGAASARAAEATAHVYAPTGHKERKSRVGQGFPQSDRAGYEILGIERNNDDMTPTLAGGSAGRHFRRSSVLSSVGQRALNRHTRSA